MKFIIFLLFVSAIYCACPRTPYFVCCNESLSMDECIDPETGWYDYCSAYSTECNDAEMFLQCEQAQYAINDYCSTLAGINITLALWRYIPDLGCSNSIKCYTPSDSNATYCQNMDSYNKCLEAPNLIQSFVDRVKMLMGENMRWVDLKRLPVPTFDCRYDPNSNFVYQYSVHNSDLDDELKLHLFLGDLLRELESELAFDNFLRELESELAFDNFLRELESELNDLNSYLELIDQLNSFYENYDNMLNEMQVNNTKKQYDNTSLVCLPEEKFIWTQLSDSESDPEITCESDSD
jgi:hypothetical protein